MVHFCFNDTATTEIYTYCHTLSLHDALPIFGLRHGAFVLLADDLADGARRLQTGQAGQVDGGLGVPGAAEHAAVLGAQRRSEEHTSELQSLMRISYAVFCLKKKNKHTTTTQRH